MSDFMIITDSTSDLGSSITAKHGIQVVPLKVTFGEEIMADGIDCTSELIFQRVKENGILPKTSAAAPAEFTQVFEPIIQSGKQVLYIGISSDFSSTIQNAHIAAADYPEGTVEIVDSRNLSTGIGLLVMKAVECKMQGLSLQQTAALLREMTD